MNDPLEHARWLNTLSYLENCGARLIARSEHPTMVTREILKHAAEEFRHAYTLKNLIHRIYPPGLPDYSPENMIGGFPVLHYIYRLNARLSRWLKSQFTDHQTFKTAAYCLVTYAIEVRALEVYNTYQAHLRKTRSPITIASIIREEEHHLAEINEEIDTLPNPALLRQKAEEIESELYTACSSKFGLTVEFRSSSGPS